MSDITIKTLKDTKSVKSSFYVGVVEDIQDPEKLDRVRVRVMGIHIEKKSGDDNHLKTEELPWANVLAPTMFGMSTGVGISFAPIQGTWVLVVFENDDLQKPIVMGSMKGFVTKNQTTDSDKGFRDPEKIYPLQDRINESDTNRLHRNEKYSETDLAKKRDSNLESGIRYTTDGSGTSGKWSMPREMNTNTKYPHNTVIETKTGHIIEIDDTPGNERIHIFHTSGSFTEFRPDGSVSTKITANEYKVVNGSKHELINGQYALTTDGDQNFASGGDYNQVAGGGVNIGSGDRISLKAGGEVSIAGGNIFLN